MDEYLLIVVAPPALEETLVDWLLEQDDVSGFSTAEVYGHGSRPSGMSLLEQVTGRQRRVQFTLHTGQEHAHALLEQLKTQFSDTGLHFMLLPLAGAGRI